MNRWATWMISALAATCLSTALAQEKDNVAGPYVPTPWPIVDELLKIAEIGPQDVVYDLGSGDGRLVITAAKRYGARGVGIEMQKTLVERATAEAGREGVGQSVRFVEGDLFEASFRDATVVTLYLLPRFVTRLVPKLRAELRPGARVVSHDYPLSPWPPDKTLTFDVDEKEPITGSKRTVLYHYVVPAAVEGAWTLSLPKSILDVPASIELRQSVESTEGTARVGRDVLQLRDPVVRGERVRFGLLARGRLLRFDGTVSGASMSGEVSASGSPGHERWSATRTAQ
jgi:ubiquinone/menaquinone biosynthesis C-methylase UbiE